MAALKLRFFGKLAVLIMVIYCADAELGGRSVGTDNRQTLGFTTQDGQHGPDDENFNNDPQQQFRPSPYSPQYQQSMLDFMGNMMNSMPWFNRRPQQGQVIIGTPIPRPSGLRVDMSVTRAVAVLNSTTSSISGIAVLTEDPNTGLIVVTGNITGLPANSIHGFHVHQYGDLSGGCMSAGSHFNPYNSSHGAPTDTIRHVGDLGNVNADGKGMVTLNLSDGVIALGGPNSIVGRALVVHQLIDDLGLGMNSDSKTTGHAGGRMLCGVIGIAAA